MSEYLLEYIEIKDFKCFKDFKAEGFKRVNLIGGKNNVGKTAFMEACYINVHSLSINLFWTALANVKGYRENLEFLGKKITNQDILSHFESTKSFIAKSNYCSSDFSILNIDGKKEYKFNINNIETVVNINQFSFISSKQLEIKFIDNFGFDNSQLKEVFVTVQRKDKEESLYKYIIEFDKNILNFKILGGDNPSCKIIDRDEYQSINEFGDGLKHYISIICSLYACEGGALFIDEIDNGIHWTQLDRLWEIILTISKEQNVQVFATTHSKECIKSYAKVSKQLEDEDISFIELGKDRDNILKAIVMDNNRFYRELKNGNSVRGW